VSANGNDFTYHDLLLFFCDLVEAVRTFLFYTLVFDYFYLYLPSFISLALFFLVM
jgi:hypothetical protein